MISLLYTVGQFELSLRSMLSSIMAMAHCYGRNDDVIELDYSAFKKEHDHFQA